MINDLRAPLIEIEEYDYLNRKQPTPLKQKAQELY